VSICWNLIGIGALLGLFSLSLYRGVQVDRLKLEVSDLREAMGEFKSMVRGLERREERVERVLSRKRRRVGSSNRRPEVLDFAYGANVPPSTANLTIYDKWRVSGDSGSGVGSYHRVSAAWEQEQAGNGLGVGEESSASSASSAGGLGQAIRAQDLHRRSRVAQSGGATHGVLIEVDGRLGGIQAQSKALPTQAPALPTAAALLSSTIPTVFKRPQLKSLGSRGKSHEKQRDPNTIYKRPELKSLGQPSGPTMELTAIQLEAEDSGKREVAPIKGLHTQWKLARWARHLGSSRKFPLSDGEVSVPTPGLYMVYAQVSYLGKHKTQGFSIRVNNQPEVHCDESRGVGLSISCYTGGLLYLEQGDRVSVVDNLPGQKIDSKPGKTFFGMIKLTQDWI